MRRWQAKEDLLELGRAIAGQILACAEAGDFSPQQRWESNRLGTTWRSRIRPSS